MASILLKDKEINKFKESYKKFKIPNTSEHADATYKFSGCTITLYKTGKAFFQGPNAIKSATKWGYNETKDVKTTNHLEYAGSDEVGTGDFFGPIVVAACYVNKSISQKLKKLGVGDSKKINDTKILELAPMIMDLTDYEVIKLHNTKYNEMIQKHNMNEIKAFMHNSALIRLNERKDIPVNIVDEFASAKNFYKYLKQVDKIQQNIELHQKAEDKYIGVAAASVIARFEFLEEMKKLNKEFNLEIPFGAGVKIDNLISKLDDNTLYKIGKLNFKNYKKTR